MEKYLAYWDKVFDYWVEHGKVPPEESFWDFDSIGLLPELMPEPYLGDPANCSAVIINYNPGADDYDLNSEDGRKAYQEDCVHHSQLGNPDKMCYHYANNYREKMKNGGYVGRGTDPMYDSSNLHPAGKKWWCKRIDWLKELAPESTKNPFALELCGWHSNTWNGMKYTRGVLDKLKERLAHLIEESIKSSDLGIGICIGAQWGQKILPAFGYKDITAEVMGLTDYKRGWAPLGGTRKYCIMRNDNGTVIINTWKASFRNMDVPNSDYRAIEKDMIDQIKSLADR